MGWQLDQSQLGIQKKNSDNNPHLWVCI